MQWTVGAFGPQPEVVVEVAVEDAELSDTEIIDDGIPLSQKEYTRNLIVLDPISDDEKLIKWDADVTEEAKRHAFR